MQSPAMWQVFQILTLLVGVANLALLAMFMWGIFSPDALPRTIALFVAILPLVGLIFTLQPDFTPFVKGANDNASGAAAVLAFAERLKTEPLQNTAVFLVNTGCEEVGCFVISHWIERHVEHDAPNASFLVLDNLRRKGAGGNHGADAT